MAIPSLNNMVENYWFYIGYMVMVVYVHLILAAQLLTIIELIGDVLPILNVCLPSR